MNVVGVSAVEVRKAVRILKAGGVVIAPTDSVYGLFGDALNGDAVNRLRRIKGRESGKPFQIAVLKEEAGFYGVLNDSALKLIERYWPGDVNIIVVKKPELPDFVTIGTVCLTCHSNRIADALVRGAGRPLVSTSVNLSGMAPAVRIGDIESGILDQADLALDGGETRNKKPNTIVDLTKTPAEVVREGPVKAGELACYINLRQ